MALTAVNPEVLSWPGNSAPPLTQMLATDSKTWKKGEMFFLTSGAPDPVVNAGKTDVYGIFAETQTSSTSTSTVWVRRLTAGTRLAMFVMTSGSAASASTPTIGTAYGVETLSNVCYLDTGTANGQFRVIRTMSNAQPLQDGYEDMDAAPGLVEVEFLGYVS